MLTRHWQILEAKVGEVTAMLCERLRSQTVAIHQQELELQAAESVGPEKVTISLPDVINQQEEELQIVEPVKPDKVSIPLLVSEMYIEVHLKLLCKLMMVDSRYC